MNIAPCPVHHMCCMAVSVSCSMYRYPRDRPETVPSRIHRDFDLWQARSDTARLPPCRASLRRAAVILLFSDGSPRSHPPPWLTSRALTTVPTYTDTHCPVVGAVVDFVPFLTSHETHERCSSSPATHPLSVQVTRTSDCSVDKTMAAATPAQPMRNAQPRQPRPSSSSSSSASSASASLPVSQSAPEQDLARDRFDPAVNAHPSIE